MSLLGTAFHHRVTETQRSSNSLFSLCLCDSVVKVLLLHVNIARARAHAEHRSATAHFAANRLAGFLHLALHGHLDWRIYVDRARAGSDVGVESGVRGQAHVHIARAGADFPTAALRAFGGNVATAGFGVECSLN